MSAVPAPGQSRLERRQLPGKQDGCATDPDRPGLLPAPAGTLPVRWPLTRSARLVAVTTLARCRGIPCALRRLLADPAAEGRSIPPEDEGRGPKAGQLGA